MLDANTAGVIVGIDKDTARVLTNQSTLQKNDIRLCRVSSWFGLGWNGCRVFVVGGERGRGGVVMCVCWAGRASSIERVLDAAFMLCECHWHVC